MAGWGVKSNFVTDFDVQLKAELHNVLFKTLSRLGEESVRRIRDRAAEESWNDDTGNLRSSIGYGVVINGDLRTQGGNDKSYGSTGGAEGRKNGAEFIRELAGKYRTGYALILVAGMEYATYVEEMENKDVLNSTALHIYGKMNEEMQKVERALVKVIERKYGVNAKN